jgi:hypothetical protein
MTKQQTNILLTPTQRRKLKMIAALLDKRQSAVVGEAIDTQAAALGISIQPAIPEATDDADGKVEA